MDPASPKFKFVYLLGEPLSSDFDEGGCDGFHVALVIVERYAPGADRVLVLVSVHALKQKI